MYNPALPNHYRDVVFTAYVRRRQREEAEALEAQRQPNALASALSSLDSPSSVFSEVEAPSGLGVSAEELHLRRIKESAALGIQSAVDMEKAVLEVEYKKKKMEGADARSRISSRLDKLKALAAKSKKLTESSAASAEQGEASTLSATDLPASTSQPPDSPSFVFSPVTTSAPLVFQHSSLAAGGFVMTVGPAESSSSLSSSSSSLSPPSSSPVQRMVRGKPSSTLLLRYRRDTAATAAWTVEQLATAAASPTAAEAFCAPLLRQIEPLCRRFGFVRGFKARIHRAEEVAAVLGILETNETMLRREQLRLWVRYDSVAEAFKAAESLAKEPTTSEGPVFYVCFYPTGLFDTDALVVRAEDEKVVL